MKNSISLFFPLRAGSTRVKRKNTRPFSNAGESIFEIKLKQIYQLLDEVSEIVVSTNDQEVLDQIPKTWQHSKIKVVHRSEELCTSTTPVASLITHAAEATSGDHIFWVHATAPFVNQTDYRDALTLYRSEVIEQRNFDSLMSVNKIQQFIYDDESKKIINSSSDSNTWINTQDLTPLYEINHAFYINSRKNYESMNDRIGLQPALYICSGEKTIDIDWPEDFKIAKILYSSLIS